MALLFGSVGGRSMPVLANLLGAESRICRALDAASLDEAALRVDRLLRTALPEGWFDRLRTPSHAGPLGNSSPRNVRSGACQQIVRLGGGELSHGEVIDYQELDLRKLLQASSPQI